MINQRAIIFIISCFNLIHILQAYSIILAYNCGQNQSGLSTNLLTFTKDDKYSIKSKSVMKQSLPSAIANEQDKLLLKSERTSDQTFGYNLKIVQNGHYMLIMKFIQTVHKNKDDRVFNIKLGQQKIYRTDIIAEVGYGKVLHKWVEFDLDDSIIYLNKTYPALNAYIIRQNVLKLYFEKVKGNPKVQAIILVKGDDCTKFLEQFLSYQESKSVNVREYISEKYHNPPTNPYKYLDGTQILVFPHTGFLYYLKKVFSVKILACILSVHLILFYDQLCEKIKNKIRGLISKQKHQ